MRGTFEPPSEHFETVSITYLFLFYLAGLVKPHPEQIKKVARLIEAFESWSSANMQRIICPFCLETLDHYLGQFKIEFDKVWGDSVKAGVPRIHINENTYTANQFLCPKCKKPAEYYLIGNLCSEELAHFFMLLPWLVNGATMTDVGLTRNYLTAYMCLQYKTIKLLIKRAQKYGLVKEKEIRLPKWFQNLKIIFPTENGIKYCKSKLEYARSVQLEIYLRDFVRKRLYELENYADEYKIVYVINNKEVNCTRFFHIKKKYIKEAWKDGRALIDAR